MYALIGAVVGILVDVLVIKPIERRRIRKELIEKGIVPKEANT